MFSNECKAFNFLLILLNGSTLLMLCVKQRKEKDQDIKIKKGQFIGMFIISIQMVT